MVVNVKCPSCGESQRLSDEVLGQKLNCPSCGAGFRVAAPKSGAPASPHRSRPRPDPDRSTPTHPRAAPGPPGGPPGLPPGPGLRPTRSDRRPSTRRPGSLDLRRRGRCGGRGPLCRRARDPDPRRLRFGRLPDPAADIALGVASPAGLPPAQIAAAPPRPSQPAVTPTAAPTSVAALNVPAPAPPRAPPPTTLAASTATRRLAGPLGDHRHALARGIADSLDQGPPLTTAQIVAKWEPSVALVKGLSSSGTGFLVRPGIVATNSHVIDEEFISGLEVRFPSASEGKQGPLPAELLYEDPKRDLVSRVSGRPGPASGPRNSAGDGPSFFWERTGTGPPRLEIELTRRSREHCRDDARPDQEAGPASMRAPLTSTNRGLPTSPRSGPS